MTLIQSGDYILHHCDKQILSISKVISGCYDCLKPANYTSGDWSNDGYRIDVQYYDLDDPFDVMAHKESLRCPENARKGNAFTKEGKPTQSYICTLEDEQTLFLLTKILANQRTEKVINVIVAALETFGYSGGIDDATESYADDDKIKKHWYNCSGTWNHEKKPAQTVQTGGVLRTIPHRDPKVSINALKHADNKCENENSHITFKRKNVDNNYMESHHLIPISKYKDFQYSLDIEENVICLCPTCHRLLHNGRMDQRKKEVLKKLFDLRKSALHDCGIDITLEQLEEYYK